MNILNKEYLNINWHCKKLNSPVCSCWILSRLLILWQIPYEGCCVGPVFHQLLDYLTQQTNGRGRLKDSKWKWLAFDASVISVCNNHYWLATDQTYLSNLKTRSRKYNEVSLYQLVYMNCTFKIASKYRIHWVLWSKNFTHVCALKIALLYPANAILSSWALIDLIAHRRSDVQFL